MIFKIFIGLFLLALVLYYFFCFIELIGLVKWTPKHMTMESPKWLLPFYYLFASKSPKSK